MKNCMIRTCIAVAMLVVSLLCLFFNVSLIEAKAESITEIESNNTYLTATPISIGAEVTGNLYYDDDKDFYKFTIPTRGYFYATVRPAVYETKDYNPNWYVYFYDSTGVNGVLGTKVSTRFYASEEGRTSEYGVEAGTYYMEINNGTYGVYTDGKYIVTISFVATDNWEVENNSAKAKASTISLNTQISARLNYSEDKDWFKFEIPKASAVKFKFKTPDEYWQHDMRFYIYDSNSATIPGLKSYYYLQANEVEESGEVTLGEGTYYIYTRCGNSSSYAIEGIYNFEIVYTCSHSYGTPVEIDGSNHQSTCTICGSLKTSSHSWQNGSIIEHATCKETGSQNQSCACGASRTVTLPKTNSHSYSSYTSISEISHTKTCSICDKVLTENHRWNSGMVIQPATCTSAGIRQYSCLDCGANKQETLATVHSWGKYVNEDEIFHKRVCTLCLKTETDYHDWDRGVIVEDATCAKQGKILYTCTTCDATKETSIPLSQEHIYGSFISDNENTHSKSCEVCNNKITDQHLFGIFEKVDENMHKQVCSCGEEKVLMHEYGEWQVVKNATEYAEGKEERTCAVCGAKDSKAIPVVKTTILNQPVFWVVSGIMVFIIVISVIVESKKMR